MLGFLTGLFNCGPATLDDELTGSERKLVAEQGAGESRGMSHRGDRSGHLPSRDA